MMGTSTVHTHTHIPAVKALKAIMLCVAAASLLQDIPALDECICHYRQYISSPVRYATRTL
jgi:hypothetical protein